MSGQPIRSAGSEPFVADPDFTLHLGDVREVLAELPAGSVDCVVTSPPYWGLRDYGTGQWDGGDPGCDHAGPPKASDKSGLKNDGRPLERVGQNDYERAATVPYRDVCGKCGATRVDRQIGLEPTPELYVEQMVAVFREVRRVLAPHGTCWLNLGDSYNAYNGNRGLSGSTLEGSDRPEARPRFPSGYGLSAGGLKPKDLVGIPWRVAFALQADGWYLRSDITWCKPNAMPESVTDRPTKATEMVFLLTKSSRYYYDAEAIREPHKHDGRAVTQVVGQNGSIQHRDGERWPGTGANARNWWVIPTQAFAEAHFATFPEALAERCIKAGCPVRVCVTCGKASERIMESVGYPDPENNEETQGRRKASGEIATDTARRSVLSGARHAAFKAANPDRFIGWSDCGHGNYRTGVVLDPFMGSGTVALVARRLGRKSVGIELNPEYAELCARRLQQLSLLAEGAA